MQIKVNIKAPRHWHLCGEFTGYRWIPRTNGQLGGKCLHLMTSSCRFLRRSLDLLINVIGYRLIHKWNYPLFPQLNFSIYYLWVNVNRPEILIVHASKNSYAVLKDTAPQHDMEKFTNCLFRRRSKKTLKLHVTGLCVGNSPGTDEFPAQKPSNAENVSIWWRHHGLMTPSHHQNQCDYSASNVQEPHIQSYKSWYKMCFI